MINPSTQLYLFLTVFLLLGAGFLHLTAKTGEFGRKITDFFCYAPGIDLALAYFMLLPLAIGIFFQGWLGVGIALLAELTSLWLWIILHELTHQVEKNQKIHPTLSKIVGGCPIRFYSEKKCANCQIDFPDVNNGWVNAEATMKDVTELLKEKYTSNQEENSWFGHPERKQPSK